MFALISRRIGLFSGILALGVAGVVEVNATPVEVSHPVAPFLRRLSEKGAAPQGFWNTLPRDSREIVAALATASHHPSLGNWDKRRIEQYLNELDPERRSRTSRLVYRDTAYHLIAGAEFFAAGAAIDSASELDRWAFGSFTPRLEATYNSNLFLVAGGTVSMERSAVERFNNYNFDPQYGLPFAVRRQRLGKQQGVITFDGFRAVTGFRNSALGLDAGQDWNQWGPGHWQHTTLSARPYFWVQDSLAPSPSDSRTEYDGNRGYFQAARRGYRYPGEGPPLPQIRLRLSGTNWEYTKIVAKRTGLDKDSGAHLVAHRVEVRLGNWTFGGTEMLAIGTRGPDALALIPLVPLKIAEHDAGDRDNSAMGADVEWTIRGHGRVYGEMFLDDFSGTPYSYWGNKFSWLVGGSWQDPLGLPTELHVEYAHVDPWVYGHHLYNTQMQNYGALLGSSLPPNSRAVSASANFPLPATMIGLVEWRFRQRDLVSRGSSIFDDWYSSMANPTPQEETKQFLARNVESRHDLAFSTEWSWKHHVLLKAGIGGLWVQNDRGRPGVTRSTPTAFSEVRFTY